MQDSTINYQVSVTGIEDAKAKFASLGGTLERLAVKQNGTIVASGKISSNMLSQAKATNKVAEATERASKSQAGYFGHIAKTTIQSALINKLFLEMVDVVGQSIEQVDLINNFPATMRSMGQSVEESNKALQSMRDYVGQIGGNLGDATSMVTRFTGVTGDVEASVAVFKGINNALIAGDSTLEERRQALIQFAQAFERGVPDAREWRNFQQNMSFQLKLVAEAMDYPNAERLGEALRSGEASMAQFTATLTELSTGNGPIAQQALQRMQGMQFAFGVMKNTMVQGLAAIIDAFNRANIVAFFSFITDVIKVLVSWVLTLINVIIWLINLIGSLFGMKPIGLKDDLAGVADNTGSAADNAGDLSDGLGKAGKKAKELNKSLASFDKMNVLPDKESASGGGSGGSGGGGAGGGAFDNDLLDQIKKSVGDVGAAFEKISIWAKILAGVLATLGTIKFGQFLINQLDGIYRAYNKLKNGLKIFGNSMGSFAGFITNPWVLLAIAIALVVTGLIVLYRTNEDFKKGFDSVWGPIIKGLKFVAILVGVTLVKAWQYLREQLGFLAPVLQPVVDVFISLWGWIKETAEKLGLLKSPMETFGKVVGVAAAIMAAIFFGPTISAIALLVGAVVSIVAQIVALVWVVKKLWNIWKSVWNKMNEKAQEAWQKLQSTWDGVTKWFVDLWHGIVSVVSDVWHQIGQYIQWTWNDMQSIWDGITSFFVGIWQGVKNVFNAVWAWLKEWGLTVLAVLYFPFTIMLAVIITVVGAIYAAFMWLWDGIVAIYSIVSSFFAGVFQSAWDAVVSIWNVATAYFKAVWTAVTVVFSVVSSWFKDQFQKAWDQIVAVWSVVAGWFDTTVWQPIVAIFSSVAEWFGERFNNAWENVKRIWGALGDFFKQRWENVKTNLSNVAEWFRDTFQKAWNKITGVFSGLWTWFRDNVWNKIVSLFSTIGTSIGNAISGAFRSVVNTALRGVTGMINGFISTINWAIRTINKFPGVSVNEVPKLTAPQLARGGVVGSPTLAMIGEDGSEAVVPLERNTEWIDKIAAKINSANGNSNGQPVQITIQIGEETIATKVIDLINEKTQMSGRNAIYV